MPTIVPLIREDVWLPALSKIPVWEPPMVPTLVIAPHPDDETLGAGGLIAKLRSRHVPVEVVAVTNGEGAYPDAPNLGDIRISEQKEALRRLDVHESMIHRLHLPDRDVAAYEDELANTIMKFATGDTHLVAPWQRDFHPDHEAAGRAAERVARAMGASLSFYLFWTWHRGTPALLEGLTTVKMPLTTSELSAKVYALDAHVSQFESSDGQPILSESLAAPAHRQFEVYIR